MTMAACYTRYDVLIPHGLTTGSASTQQQQHVTQISQPLQQQLQSSVAAATALVTVTAAAAASSLSAAANSNLEKQKDYSIPLHVDCSVEYELPNQPKPPAGQRVEPLLMIHPCYFRKMESQRRSPFVNNMPNSSRNNASLLTPTTQNSNIVQPSSLVSSTRRTSIRHQQQSQVPHHHHTRQTSIVQYNTTHHQNLQQQQQFRPSQSNPQQQMSQMSQQAHYPSVSVTSSVLAAASGQYIERASAIRRAAAASVHRDHKHGSAATSSVQKHSEQHQTQNHQQNLLVQNSSSSSLPTHWDQLAAVATIVTSIAPLSTKILPPVPHISLLNQCTMKCSTTNSSVGKRDALISGGYSTRSTSTALAKSQPIKYDNNRTSCSNKHRNIQNSYGISTSLVDTTNLRWNTAACLMVDRSPIATVPSNYQAGPDTTPTQLNNTVKTNNDNKNGNIETSAGNSGKYRQYLRSHRIHPYLQTSASSKLCVTPTAVSTNHIGQSVPHFSEAVSAAGVFETTPSSFQQHLQQISTCYNV